MARGYGVFVTGIGTTPLPEAGRGPRAVPGSPAAGPQPLMNADRRAGDKLLPHAYSQVTDPERFRPLHRIALDLLERLAVEYDVSRSESFEMVPGLTPFENALTPITLTPNAATAAPIAVAFTAFPSLVTRFGRWVLEAFPSCACDACARTAEEEGGRLEELVRQVVAGRFREELLIPRFRDGRLSWSFGGLRGPHSGGWTRLARSRALALGGRSSRIDWAPWPWRREP